MISIILANENLRIIKLFSKIAYYAVITGLAVLALLVIVSAFSITGSYKLFVVQSGSMEPAINTGGVVLVKPAEEYRIGDIITFGKVSRTKVPTTHRIHDIRIQDGVPIYTTKGDANEDPDSGEIRDRDIIGRVVLDVPYVGYAVATARKPYGFVALIVVPAAIIIFDQSKKIFLEVKRMKSQKTESPPMAGPRKHAPPKARLRRMAGPPSCSW